MKFNNIGLVRMLSFIVLTACFSLTLLPSDADIVAQKNLSRIRLSKDSAQFFYADSGERYIAWGFNYDRDDSGRLLEDYWVENWAAVEEDFREMKALGANVVRIHLQVAKFMAAPDATNEASLKRLALLLKLAEKTGLYLDITGLGCYHKQDVPAWYDAASEAERWSVQVCFWEAVAKTCAESSAVFCYDLMNEPILPGADKAENEWLTGELDGKYFVQRITLDLAGRTREQVAKAWVDELVGAIRKHDRHHLITVGVIPWVLTFPKAKPLFYSKEVCENLDFVSVHFYPNKGEVDKALTALAAYDIGKPLVVEECYPLFSGIDDFDVFVDGSRERVEGFIGFYWGTTSEEYRKRTGDIGAGIIAEWLDYFHKKGSDILGAQR